ncbi:MAG: DUF4834 family protein [Bacteroides sp.]|nr:DUF4834 family protein [Bacteroides sp.]
MFHLFGFLFLIIIAVFVIGLSLIVSLVSRLFGRRSHTGFYTYSNSRNSSASQEAAPKKESKISSSSRKKIFEEDEGEYVEFEEINSSSSNS